MIISPDNSPQDIIDAVEAAARQRAEQPQPMSGAEARRREAFRAQAAQPQQTKAERNWTAWAAINPAAADWITRHEASFEFAAAMRGAVERWGGLTSKQNEAVVKCMVREAQRASRPAAEDLDTGSVAALRDCFDRAAANRADSAVLRLALTEAGQCVDAFAVSAAPANGRNPGALYVKQRAPFNRAE